MESFNQISKLNISKDIATKHLNPLVKTDLEYNKFKNRHSKNKVMKKNLSEYEGDCFLGIDAGSTTSKIVLIDNNGVFYYEEIKSKTGIIDGICSSHFYDYLSYSGELVCL